MSQERSEAGFAESYMGGDSEDYDVIKVDGGAEEGRVVEATDRTLDTWNEIWKRTQAGFETNASYCEIMGLDAKGHHDPDLIKYVNAENLIDYLMIIFITEKI